MYKIVAMRRDIVLTIFLKSLIKSKIYTFNVNKKSARDRLKVLERAFKKKDQPERIASGISPEDSEVDNIKEDYLEREEQENEYEKISLKTS